MPGRFEAPHAPLALAGRLVRILRAVVEPFVLAMLDAGQDLALRRAVAGQLVGDDHARHVGEALEQAAKELLGSGLIAPGLHQDIEHGAVLVDGAPQIVLRAVDLDEDLVEMPLVAGPWPLPPERIGVALAELAAPLADRLVAQDHAPLGQELLHVAIAQREAEIQPHRVGDDLCREAISGIGRARDFILHATSIARRPPALPS